MIEARDLALRIGARNIVDGVSFAIRPGRVTALLGPNGAGKSTLISLLSGEHRPDGGSVEIDGEAMESFDPLALAKRRAVLLQHSSLDFDFTVAEVVALGRLPFRATRDALDDDEACLAARCQSGIEPLWSRLYRTLSGGERQRVQFARALAQIWRRENGVSVRRYLMLDEPTSALDLRHRRLLLESSRRLAGEGIGVLAVLHDLNLAADYADDVVLLDNGRVMAAGEKDQVLTQENLSACFMTPVEIMTRADGSKAILA
ncbi:heme ABC transporter ATP-binding protein [Parvibaculum sedimenti]|uniref:Heme ABC transporter ATP-binding protein n=1 Tax=Parvibaculum sedimenti TaxID=2608632 RepID=A0A6N6VDT0_9HYPH|nr:heme ABC transporter ATP-binding protein [Parvibaculum sedimenti]KAB7738816.1 heme ABC transporter ATP-binding protein [Parvibaculum sedimenti]